MSICFLTIILIGVVVTLVNPLQTPAKLPVSDTIVLESSKTAKIGGVAVIAAMIVLYIMFW
jgi:SSS family solute:Na+ symporter